MFYRILLLGILVLTMEPGALASGKETVQFDSRSIDLGIVESGETVSGHFLLKNLTNERIKLFIAAECDCAIETPTLAFIEPNSEYMLPVQLYLDTETDHIIEDTFSVLVENPHMYEVALTVRAVVKGGRKKQLSMPRGDGYGIFLPVGEPLARIDETVYAAYFYKPGCIVCDRANLILEKIKAEYPNLQIREYNSTVRDNILLFERMSQPFDLPDQYMLRAPSFFFSSGVLINEAITEDRVRLILDSGDRSLAAPPWNFDDAGSGAVGSLIERSSSISFIAIILAGLLDGINPCAFATLIFFVSFLQVMKRTPFETVVIGFTFTAAVFLTYLGVGLGFFMGVKPLMEFKWVTFAFYLVSGVVAVILALFSIRDGFKARRGELKEMSLQLSDGMKKRIHSIISSRSRKSGIVAGTFFTGVAISLLELGCTGQVYLPVITFILQVPELRMRGVLLLTAYNIAFIIPLIIVFVMVFLGTGWQSANRWFLKNIAATKFLLGVLFLFFGCVIFYNIVINYILPLTG